MECSDKDFLPDEAKVIVDNISRIPGGDNLVEMLY